MFFGKRGAIVSLQTGEPADVLRLRLCHGTVHALRRFVYSLERPVSPCRVGVLAYHVFRVVVAERGRCQAIEPESLERPPRDVAAKHGRCA